MFRWMIGDPFPEADDHEVRLRFCRRKMRAGDRTTTYGIVSSPSGTMIVYDRPGPDEDPGPGAEARIVMQALSLVRSETAPGRLIVISPIRIKGLHEALLDRMLTSEPFRIADEDDLGPIGPMRLNVLSVITDAENLPEPAEVADHLEAAHMLFSGDRESIVIDDVLPAAEEIFPAQGGSPGQAPPLSLLIGRAGTGKSTLASAIFGTGRYDLPPSAMSRSTLYPAVMTNDPTSQSFSVRVRIRSARDAYDHLVAHFQEARREDAGGVNASLLNRSADMRMPLRLVLGREGARDLAMDLEHAFSFDPKDVDDALSAIATGVFERVIRAIEDLPFGRTSRDESGVLFFYDSRSLAAAAAASRRFVTINRADSGKAFTPFCGRIDIRGPFLPDHPPFSIMDPRGFDHEGSLADDLPAAIVTEARVADHIIILMSAVKAGDREETRVLRRLSAEGLQARVTFVATRADEVLENGQDPAARVADGLTSSLAALAADVGPKAAEAIVRRARGVVPVFGGLGSGSERHDGPLVTWPDGDGGHSNAASAETLIRIMSGRCAETDENVAEILAGSGLSYEGSAIIRATSEAADRSAAEFDAVYGAPGNNHGLMSWQAIKAETHRVMRFFSESGGDRSVSGMARVSDIFASSLISALSRVLDAPLSQAENDPVRAQAQRDALRRALSVAAERIAHDRVIWGARGVWTRSDGLSMVSFGPGSTFMRNEVLREITSIIRGGVGRDADLLADEAAAYVIVERTR